MKKLWMMGAMALMLAACGEGVSSGAGAKGDISADRTAAFKSFMPNFSSMGKVVKGEEPYDVEKFKTAAAQFVVEAHAPFEFFQNDPNGNGDALPVIWEKPQEFAAEQEKFLNAVNQLNEAAQTGRLDEIKAKFGEVGASCQACHDTFRAPK